MAVDENIAANEVTRRDMIKRVGAGAAIVWTMPILSSINTPAFAATGTPIPRPECEGASCGSFHSCSSTNADCICATTDTGAGFCVPGSTPCAGLADCPCPSGYVCLVDTCCVRPVCVPISLQDECPVDEEAAPLTGFSTQSAPSNETIGGY